MVSEDLFGQATAMGGSVDLFSEGASVCFPYKFTMCHHLPNVLFSGDATWVQKQDHTEYKVSV